MTNQAQSLSFESRGREYALVKKDATGRVGEILLSDSDILLLPKLLQDISQKIIAAQSDSAMMEHGVYPVIAVPVINLQLNTDISNSSILLTFVDQFGNSSSFALPQDIAQPLSRRLVARLAEMTPTS